MNLNYNVATKSLPEGGCTNLLLSADGFSKTFLEELSALLGVT